MYSFPLSGMPLNPYIFFSKAIENKSNKKTEINSLAELAKSKTLTVYLADDDMDDRELFRDAFSEVLKEVNLHFAIHGENLLELLLEPDEVPDIIFLDLNMPRKNGFECLEEIRIHKRFNNLPVIIYSTTANPNQIKNSFLKGANLYWQKPLSYEQIKQMLHKILHLNFEHYTPKPKQSSFILKV